MKEWKNDMKTWHHVSRTIRYNVRYLGTYLRFALREVELKSRFFALPNSSRRHRLLLDYTPGDSKIMSRTEEIH